MSEAAAENSPTHRQPRRTLPDSETLARTFHRELCEELTRGNPELGESDLAELRGHYERIMEPDRYPRSLVETIYSARRAPALSALRDLPGDTVLDAGCAFGSESFLFAAQGCHVVAIDRSPEKIAIARRRKPYFEDFFGKKLSIDFDVANLDDLSLEPERLGLTWVASVLAVITDQRSFLERIRNGTRQGGRIMITDMNLRNPLFLLCEWNRARTSRRTEGSDTGPADPEAATTAVEEASFFSGRTLADLLERSGFAVESVRFSGFVPPQLANRWSLPLESICASLPGLRSFGYFYLTTGRVASQAEGRMAQRVS